MKQINLVIRLVNGRRCRWAGAWLLGLVWLLTALTRLEGAPVSYKTVENIPYRDGKEPAGYMRERCVLDIYYPEGVTDFPTVIWFHGGGLTEKEKFFPESLKGKGIAIVAPNYRLSPKAKSPVFMEDAAAAVAWVVKNIATYGGSPGKLIVSGHSAGGYLACMVVLDKKYLGDLGVDSNKIAGLAPLSAQVITHFTVRLERGIPGTTPVVDELAPLFHLRKDAPPTLLVTGDREMELLGRYEENAYFWRMAKIVGHTETDLIEIKGMDHGGMMEPGYEYLLRFVQKISSTPRASEPVAVQP